MPGAVFETSVDESNRLESLRQRQVLPEQARFLLDELKSKTTLENALRVIELFADEYEELEKDNY